MIMTTYVIREGKNNWKEDVKKFNDYERAIVYFKSIVYDYRLQGSKFTQNITGSKKEWEVELVCVKENDTYILDEEILELEVIK